MMEKLDIRNKADIDTDLPLISIVGRPNVGKSTLFNRLIGKRRAITDPTPGVTRDPIPERWLLGNHPVTLVDTGGVKLDKEGLDFAVTEKSLSILAMSDIILFMMDCMEITAEDMMLLEEVRPYTDKVILVVNKVDDPKRDDLVWNYFSYGYQRVVGISAAHGLGIEELEDTILGMLNMERTEEIPEEPDSIKLAIMGKPNTGKSTLTNLLTGRDVSIVSDIAGTTRDVMKATFVYKGTDYTVLDTAGIRRKSKVEEDVEYYSVNRAIKTIDEADVVLLMIAVNEGLAEQDKKIAGYAHESGKGVIIVVNKWDVFPDKDDKSTLRFTEDLRDEIGFLQYAPVLYTSALTGQRIHRITELVKYVADQQSMRIQTSVLNELIRDAVSVNPPPSHRGKQLKIFFMTQADIQPPKFIIFVNDPELMHFSYLRFLENRLRESFGFEGTPLKLIVRGRKEEEDY